jgi:hypothetical protein
MGDKLISGNGQALYNRAKAIKPENNGQGTRNIPQISQLRNFLLTPSSSALLRKIFEGLDAYTEQTTTQAKVKQFLIDLNIESIADLKNLKIFSMKLEAEGGANPNLGGPTINRFLKILANLTKTEFGKSQDIYEETKFPSCIGYLYDHRENLGPYLVKESEPSKRLKKLRSKTMNGYTN